MTSSGIAFYSSTWPVRSQPPNLSKYLCLIDAKYRLVTSKFYETLEDLTHAVSEYFRTCSIKLDIYKFLYRTV